MGLIASPNFSCSMCVLTCYMCEIFPSRWGIVYQMRFKESAPHLVWELRGVISNCGPSKRWKFQLFLFNSALLMASYHSHLPIVIPIASHSNWGHGKVSTVATEMNKAIIEFTAARRGGPRCLRNSWKALVWSPQIAAGRVQVLSFWKCGRKTIPVQWFLHGFWWFSNGFSNVFGCELLWMNLRPSLVTCPAAAGVEVSTVFYSRRWFQASVGTFINSPRFDSEIVGGCQFLLRWAAEMREQQ